MQADRSDKRALYLFPSLDDTIKFSDVYEVSSFEALSRALLPHQYL